MTTPRRRRLEVEQVGNVTVVTFVDKKILDEQNVQMMGDELFRLVDENKPPILILDFAHVEYLSSAAMGKFITLFRKVGAYRGRLILSGLDPAIYEIWEITRLNKMFTCCRTLDVALRVANDEPLPPLGCPLPGCPGLLRAAEEPADAYRWRCGDCRIEFGLAGLELRGSARVMALRLATYEGEAVEALHGNRFWDVRVVGRLDLFAGEALERLWSAFRDPYRVLLDLTRATELSRGGADVLARLLPAADRSVVLLGGAGPPGAALPAAVTRSADRAWAEATLTEADFWNSSAPMAVARGGDNRPGV